MNVIPRLLITSLLILIFVLSRAQLPPAGADLQSVPIQLIKKTTFA